MVRRRSSEMRRQRGVFAAVLGHVGAHPGQRPGPEIGPVKIRGLCAAAVQIHMPEVRAFEVAASKVGPPHPCRDQPAPHEPRAAQAGRLERSPVKISPVEIRARQIGLAQAHPFEDHARHMGSGEPGPPQIPAAQVQPLRQAVGPALR